MEGIGGRNLEKTPRCMHHRGFMIPECISPQFTVDSAVTPTPGESASNVNTNANVLNKSDFVIGIPPNVIRSST